MHTSEIDDAEGIMSTPNETFDYTIIAPIPPILKSIDMDIDLVFVIDVTSSVQSLMDRAKTIALDFMNGLEEAMKNTGGGRVGNACSRVVAFCNYLSYITHM